MKCAMCNAEFNDGVQCSSCKKRLDFGCANISEASWRRLGSDRRSAWKCPSCKISSSPSPSSSAEPASLDSVLSEIREIKKQLSGLPVLLSDIKTIKEELNNLKQSCEFNHAKLEDFNNRLSEVEIKMKEFEVQQVAIDTLTNDVAKLQHDLLVSDQRLRVNNVEIKGVPQQKNENLFKILEKIRDCVNSSFPDSQVNYISRIPSHNSSEKPIIVSFINRYIKEEFLAAARGRKNLTASDIGFKNNQQKVFLNDHLNADVKKLLNKTKVMAKEKDYKYVWVKFCKIHIRKTDSSAVFIINKESDLNKII